MKRTPQTIRREVTNPIVICYEQEDTMTCVLHPPKDYDHRSYGLVICDIVRHVANAFNVHEDDVWEWVDKERHNPTTSISREQ
jgi:hypothetical protein